MRALRIVAAAAPLLAAGGALAGFVSYRGGMAEADEAWQSIATRAEPPPGRFDPAMVAQLPEIARRYFTHAIAPGTELRTSVEVEMRGAFLLGDKDNPRRYRMAARQLLRPPFEFVWIPQLRSGPLRINGSDALADGVAWTRFWLMNILPVANARTSEDMVRSAKFRAAMEAIWAPAALLPDRGTSWEQIGPDRARIRVSSVTPAIEFEMILSPQGAVREIVGQRWSNANPDGIFRRQPFGGTVTEEATFDGYTIPTRLEAGNHYGTPDYLPFFQPEVIRVEYR